MNMKVMLITGLLLIAIISCLTATDSRLNSLGYPYGFIRDNTDIFYYPGSIFQYNNRIDLELRTENNENNWSIGANVPLYKNALGVYFNRPSGLYIDNYFADILVTKHNDYSIGDLNVSREIQLFYGFKEKYGVGFGMAIDSKSEPVIADPTKNITMSASYFELLGGMSDEMKDIGVKISLPMGKVNNELTKDKQTLSGIGFNLYGRYYFFEMNKLKTMALGELSYSGSSTELEEGTEKLKHSYATMMFNVGVGANYNFSANNCLILGVYPFKIRNNSEKSPNMVDAAQSDKHTSTYIYVPEYKIGLETQLLPWLTGRFGATQTFYFVTTTDKPYGEDENKISGYNSEFNTELGFGIKFKGFYIDGVINEELLFNGPNIVGGNDPGMAGMLSVGYGF